MEFEESITLDLQLQTDRVFIERIVQCANYDITAAGIVMYRFRYVGSAMNSNTYYAVEYIPAHRIVSVRRRWSEEDSKLPNFGPYYG